MALKGFGIDGVRWGGWELGEGVLLTKAAASPLSGEELFGSGDGLPPSKLCRQYHDK